MVGTRPWIFMANIYIQVTESEGGGGSIQQFSLLKRLKSYLHGLVLLYVEREQFEKGTLIIGTIQKIPSTCHCCKD